MVCFSYNTPRRFKDFQSIGLSFIMSVLIRLGVVYEKKILKIGIIFNITYHFSRNVNCNSKLMNVFTIL